MTARVVRARVVRAIKFNGLKTVLDVLQFYAMTHHARDEMEQSGSLSKRKRNDGIGPRDDMPMSEAISRF